MKALIIISLFFSFLPTAQADNLNKKYLQDGMDPQKFQQLIETLEIGNPKEAEFARDPFGCENLKVSFDELPLRCKGYIKSRQADLAAQVQRMLKNGVHKTGTDQANYCHKRTADLESFNRCVALPPAHDYACGIPEVDGVYFSNNNGTCTRVESAIVSESRAVKKEVPGVDDDPDPGYTEEEYIKKFGKPAN